ncbi:retinol dehydrogenase 13-like [Chironomus tepperi]|uniref:retinol dehydrogenase 13-like n=1 Tax=Chironomus tepperi TaxID=113505 RepID=UPI00391F784F
MASYEIKNKMYINDSARIDGKVVIVTGCNTGIGKATVHELAKRGGKIYMASRNEEATKAALNEIKESTKNEQLYFLKLDLASLKSVREFCKKFHELETRLDILINNAGLLSPLNRTTDGFEMNFGVNHLGHFLLTNLLLDLLKASAPSRIVVMSSSSHEVGIIDRDNINCEKRFPGTHKAYAVSKLCNVLFMKELAKRLEGTGVVCNALGPGRINTEAFRYLHPVLKFFIRPSLKYIAATPEVGCQTSVMLAVEPSLAEVTGCYFDKCLKIEPTIKGPEDDQLWLWDKSVELTGLNL